MKYRKLEIIAEMDLLEAEKSFLTANFKALLKMIALSMSLSNLNNKKNQSFKKKSFFEP